jgi:hypothetical protein
MPVKKSVRSKTPTAAKKSSREKTKTKSGTLGAAVIVMGMVCLMAVAIVMAARDTSDPSEIKTADVQAQMIDVDSTPAKKPAAKPSVALAATPTTGVIAADEAPAEPAPDAAAAKAPVTVAGCLQRDNDSFRLKDTSGADAPKSRSWKSGFLKKGAATIDLVDGANSARLRDNVGKRVSVTGTLTDRRMQVRSIRRVASSCE